MGSNRGVQMSLNSRSLKALVGVHPDLVAVAKLAHDMAIGKKLDFWITEGLRSVDRQKQLVAKGASATMRSRHITGDAFDFVPIIGGEPCWKWPAFWPLVDLFEKAGAKLDIGVECGARWERFPDGPHVQRPWDAKP